MPVNPKPNKPPKPARKPDLRLDLDLLPGHLMRRLHQISVGLFMSELQSTGVTPIQFAALQTLHLQPGIEQKTLAKAVALDTSTTGGVIDRLEARGWVARQASATDRRVRLLQLTLEGEQARQTAVPQMLKVQEKILAPLSPDEQTQFMTLLSKLVQENNGFSRAPSHAKI